MKPTFAKAVKRNVKLTVAVLLGTVLIAGCTVGRPAAPVSENAEPQIKTVKVAAVERSKISEPLEQVADVVSSIQLSVVTKVGGDVQEILKKRGDYVEKGEVIFRLDPTDVLLQKEKARIALESTQEQMIKARKDFENNKLDLKNGIVKLEQSIEEMEKNYNKMRNDYDLGLVTEFQLEQMEHQLNSLRLDLESSKKKLETLESTNPLSQMEQALETSRISIKEADRTLEHMEVKAPVSGVLTELPIEVGMTLPSGFSAAHIERLDPIKIKAELTEEAAKLVRGKKELTFYIPGEIDKTKAKVSYLADIMSSKTKSYTLELEVPNADLKLRPGMKAQILLTDEEDQMVVAVPALSVVREEGETYVFILKGDHVEKRKVELGRMNETVQEVISGVEEGELLVISGHNQLRDQEKVQVEK